MRKRFILLAGMQRFEWNLKFSRDKYQLSEKVLSSMDEMNYHIIFLSRSIVS